MLPLFRDVARFGYHHGSTVLALILPYVAVLFLLRSLLVIYGQENPMWRAAYLSLLLAVYPFYVGRVIKYLAWLAGPTQETPTRLSITSDEWRRLFLVNLLVTIMVSGGLLLLLLPGIYLAARFAFAEFIALLRGEGVMASLEKSWLETAPHAWPLFFGALFIWSIATLLEITLQSGAATSVVVQLIKGLGAETVSIVSTLFFTTFFFRIYCLKDG
jgi:hypothetical protein